MGNHDRQAHRAGAMPRGVARAVLLVLAVGLLAGLLAGVSAEAKSDGKPAPAPALPEPLTREAIRELVARLSDDEVRALLLAQLDKAAAPTAGPSDASMAHGMAGDAQRVRARLGTMLAAVPDLPRIAGAAVARFSDGGRDGQLVIVGAVFALMLAVAGLAEWLVGRLVADVRRRLHLIETEGLATQAGHLLVRLVLDLVGLAVFIVTALGVFLVLYEGHEPSRELILAGLVAAVQVRLAELAARLLLAPRAPGRRLLPLDDPTPGILYRGVVSLAVIYGLADVGLGFLRRWGAPDEATLAVATAVRVLFAAVFLAVVWWSRAGIAARIRGGGGPLRRVLADLWPVLMTVYVVLIALAMAVEALADQQMNSYAGILSLLVVVLLPLADLALCRLLARRAARAGAPPESAEAAGASYVPVLRQGIHIAVTVGGLLVIARLWGVDLLALTERGLGARLASAVIDIAVTLLLAYLAWQLARTAIDRRLEKEAGPVGVSDPGEQGGTGASRLRTLLPLLRGFLFVSICVMATMIVLSAIGVNIGPLLAGAGVVGLAVGFGAQTLVRDIISGAFYLMDDAFRLGEYIDVGDAKGTVEKIGIRSMQLRHHRGPLNIVPYGAVRRLNNQSRDWVVEKLEFRLTYDTDIMKVKKIIKKVGQELMEHPELGPQILQPLKSQGVLAMEDSAMLVKAKFMAKPGEQFVIRREAYQRLKKAFEEAGIKFAHRQVTVFVPPAGVDPRAAAGAAAVAAEADGRQSDASPA